MLFEILLRLYLPINFERELYYLNWTSVSKSFSRWDPVYTYRHPENSSFTHKTWDYDVTYTTDENGFRVTKNRSTSLPVPTLMMLGDSFTFGTGVADNQTVAQHIADTGHFRVINTGQSGYGTTGQLLTLREYGPRFRPDVVILIVCVSNDFYNNHDHYRPVSQLVDGKLEIRTPPQARAIFDLQKREFSSGRGFYTLKPELSARQIVNGYLRRYSRTYLVVPHVLKAIIKRAIGYQFPGHNNTERGESMEMLLKELRDLSARGGTKFFVALAAERGPVVTPSYIALLNIRDILDGLGIAYIDLNESFRKQQGWDALFHRHDGHWSPEGNAFVARELLGFISSLQLSPVTSQ